MIRWGLRTGIWGGLIISLLALYPAVSLVAPVILTGWENPIHNDLVHGILLMISAGLMVPIYLSLGIFSTRKSKVHGARSGLKVGALAGLVANFIVFMTTLAPLNALMAYNLLIKLPAEVRLPDNLIQDYFSIFEHDAFLIGFFILGGAVLNGLTGALVGWRHGKGGSYKRPTLQQLLESGQRPCQWFDNNSMAQGIGLAVGMGAGLIVALIIYGEFQFWNPRLLPEVARVLENSVEVSFVGDGPPTIFSPIVAILVCTFGLITTVLLSKPVYRYQSRISASVIAGTFIFIFLFAFALRVILFHFGLAPFMLARMTELTTIPLQFSPTETYALPKEDLITFLRHPVVILGGNFLVAWFTILFAMIVGGVVGFIQGTFWAFVYPIYRQRPVDIAASLVRKLKRDSTQALPVIYNLFSQHEEDPYEVLAHLTVASYRSLPHVAHLTAAYHTLGTTKEREEHVAAIQKIDTVISENPSWRWATDSGAVYHTLNEVLEARTLDQILTVSAPPDHQTKSLPAPLVGSVKKIHRILDELHKIEKVEDLPTKLIFLENTLTAISEANEFVNNSSIWGQNGYAPPPEYSALSNVLDHWQRVLLKATKRLKGRADVVCELKNKQHTQASCISLVYVVSNKGLNVAQDVKIKLLSSENFSVLGESELFVEILPPNEMRKLTFSICPINQPQRIRLAWEVTYDDAIDADRSVSFADVIEFAIPDKPFKKVFPIPYVTGTPLKTDSVFVGRKEIFEFIQENLLGIHQNNVIILHGQRRTGKTSVLYRLGEVMLDTHYGVLIDMQGKPARSEADFLYSIADDIVYALEDAGIEVEMPARSDFDEAPEFFFRSRFLRSLHKHLGDKHLLLMFDEFEELQRRVEEGRLQPDIFQFLRNLMQHEPWVDFIFSGTHKLEELGAEYWSILFNIAAYKPITFLSQREVKRLIEEPVAAYNVEYDPLAIENIIEVTAGHPYFTQLVLHEMMVYHNEMERNYLTPTDVEVVLGRIVERGEAHFKYIWAESTPEEQHVMVAMAELAIDGEAVHIHDLHAFLNEHGHYAEDNWQSPLMSLEGRDILTRANIKSPLYRFKVDLIRVWVERTRPAFC